MPISLSGSLNLSGSLTTTGTITATTLVVQTITSSISSITGSTNFGSLAANTHTFTGSLLVSGSGVFSSSIADYGLSIMNVQDSAQGLLVRASDNATGQYILNLQSSVGATSQTWVSRLVVEKGGNVGIGTSTVYSGAKLHILGGILAVEPTNGNTNSEILIGRGLSSLGTSAGSGITAKVNFAFEGSNDNFYQELGFITTTANQTRVNSAADFYISTKAAGSSSPTERMRVTSNTSSATLGSGSVMKLLGTSGAVGVYTELQFYTYNAPTNQPPVSLGIIKTDNGGFENGEFYIATKTTNANTAPVERMRVRSDGGVLIGKSTTSVSGAGLQLLPNGETYFTITNSINTLHVYDTTNSAYRFYVGGNGTVNATNTTISAISDVRLKENIVDLEIGLDAIMTLRPRKFDWKKESGNSGKNIRGFIAQEFEEVFPDLIDISINKAPEGQEPYKQIRQDLIPVLVKAIQELTARVQYLENK